MLLVNTDSESKQDGQG